jgi:hypothetical protein
MHKDTTDSIREVPSAETGICGLEYQTNETTTNEPMIGGHDTVRIGNDRSNPRSMSEIQGPTTGITATAARLNTQGSRFVDTMNDATIHPWNGTAPGRTPVLISEADAFLIMHLWELYPGLGRPLGIMVRTLREHHIPSGTLEDSSWSGLPDVELCPRLLAIIRKEIKVMRRIAREVEMEVRGEKPLD